MYLFFENDCPPGESVLLPFQNVPTVNQTNESNLIQFQFII